MKKLLCLALTFIMILSALSLAVSAEDTSINTPITGDIDGDRFISIIDATLVQFYLVDRTEFSLADKVSADTDGDDEVTIFDATVIQLYLARHIDSFSGDSDSTALTDSIGRMNTLHNIVLFEELENDTYTLKYENENGVLENCADICEITVDDTTEIPSYCGFIPENNAPINATKIGVYNSLSQRMGSIAFTSSFTPVLGKKLYSFGALSDAHVQYDTAQADFQRALSYLNGTEDVDFTCICGDLTVNGTDAELSQYKNYVDNYSADTPVYAVFGNHDTYQGLYNNTEKYTGFPLNYTFEQGNDVFIMVGNISGYSGEVGTLFTKETLQWLYEQLEANRNKRCFLFQHILSSKGSGDAYNIYPHTKLSGDEALIFESLISNYKNVIWFHGHTHMKFSLQEGKDIANYDNVFGVHSVHIPSLSVPRDVNASATDYETFYEGSEGYVVDVYENGVHLRGRDFVNGEFLPIASYWLDTTPKLLEANTYVDSTGTIY